jgi:hypothetical protein
MLDFAYTVLGLVIGAFLGNWFATLQLRLNRELARFDDLVVEVGQIQKAAQDYWVVGREKNASPEKFNALEAEIRGRFHLLNVIFRFLEGHLPTSAADICREAIGEFFDDATGGDFGDNPRSADLRRLQRVYTSGALLIGSLHDAATQNLIIYPEKVARWCLRVGACIRYWLTFN